MCVSVSDKAEALRAGPAHAPLPLSTHAQSPSLEPKFPRAIAQHLFRLAVAFVDHLRDVRSTECRLDPRQVHSAPECQDLRGTRATTLNLPWPISLNFVGSPNQ